MVSIKHLPVRVIKKHKSRGRPSKWEILVSQMLSEEINKPMTRKVMRQIFDDMILFGTGYYLFENYKNKKKT